MIEWVTPEHTDIRQMPMNTTSDTQPVPIALVGLSGTGKSTLARLLGAASGWSWVDTDRLIVERTGRSIPDLFAQEGEPYFRAVETAVLQTLLDQTHTTNLIIATGGGIVLAEHNRHLLRVHTYTVWLDAPTSLLLARLQEHHEQRPLLNAADPAARLEALRAARSHLYREVADQIVSTADKKPTHIMEEILRGYQAHGAT